MASDIISLEEFEKVDIRIGTITDASINKKARHPAYKLKIDFGDEIGIKWSSAQITDLYEPNDLIGKQVVCVVNFNPIRISEVKSEVRVLGADTKEGVSLLTIDDKVLNGSKIY